MKWTNRFNLPETIVNAIKFDPYQKEGHISVTQLIKSPRMRILEARHSDEIEQDVSDGLWRLLGQAIHYILERAKSDNALKEEVLKVKVLGWIVSGKPDLWQEPATLSDYKITSVYSFLLGDKPDWEAQLNFYAYLYRQHGFPVSEAYIHAILRDWMASKVDGEDYPSCPFISVKIPLWNERTAKNFLVGRVAFHQEAEKLSDEELPHCLSEERWAKPTTYAVKKRGLKRAERIFNTMQEAEQYITSLETTIKYEIDERLGNQFVRCERYCLAKEFCSQFKGGKI